MKRRRFIRNSALSTFGLSVPVIRNFGNEFPATYEIPRRELGKTGEMLSIIGFGGIMLSGNSQEFATELVSKSFELGVNYYDVAPTYGNAEERLGPALKPYRNNCFLACKTTRRDALGANAELENSLRLLQTDRFDLYQLHALTTTEDVNKAFAPGGVMETIEKAKKAGKIKHIGFSAHSVDAAMLALENYPFDSILFPVNFASWKAGDFGPQVYSEALKRGAGILALKSMALTRLKPGEKRYDKNVWYHPIEDDDLIKLALKFTLSKKVTAAIPPGNNLLYLKALEFMNDFQQITEEEEHRLGKVAQLTDPIFSHS